MTVDIHGQNLPALRGGVAQNPAPAALIQWAEAAQAAHRLAVPLCQTDFVPSHFRGNEHAATAAILYGAEAGLSPLQALQGIYVISGRPAMYARTMLAVTLGAGHEVRTMESTDVRAVVEAQRRGSSHVEKIVVTIDQAKRAGWTSNKKYSTEPATMLLARAQSQACRRVAPDALLGMAYSAEELQDEADSEPAVAKTVRRRKTADPVERPEPDIEPDAVTHTAEQVVSHSEPDVEPDVDAMTAAQSKKLHAILREQGHDRDSGLTLLSTLVGRTVTTTSDMTKAEAIEAIDALEEDRPPVQEPADELWPETARPGGAGA